MMFKRIKHERRKEKRHYCNWPIWFAAGHNSRFFYGDIVDYASDSLSLICKNNTISLHTGSLIKIYFGYSQSAFNKSCGVDIFSCQGNIYRIESMGNKFLRRNSRIAVRLCKRLPFSASRIKSLKVIFEVLEAPDDNQQPDLCLAGSGNETN